MKHYQKSDNSIWAFESDGSQDHLITPEMTPIGDSELYALRNLPKTVDEIKVEVTQATQDRLDTWARTRNYDGILSAATYATSTVPKFAAEGQSAVTARDTTWAALYSLMAEYQSGTRDMPQGFADVEPLLPVLEWPQ